MSYVHEPWLRDEELSHTTDLVSEDRAATRRAREFSSINGNLEISADGHEWASCATLQEECFCTGLDPQD